MTNAIHESIEADLARAGHTDPEHVQAALDAQGMGVDVRGVLDRIKAGLPQWLALLIALRDAGLLKGAKAPAPSPAKKKGDSAA